MASSGEVEGMEDGQERTLPVRAGDWVGSVLDPSVTARVKDGDRKSVV